MQDLNRIFSKYSFNITVLCEMSTDIKPADIPTKELTSSKIISCSRALDLMSDRDISITSRGGIEAVVEHSRNSLNERFVIIFEYNCYGHNKRKRYRFK